MGNLHSYYGDVSSSSSTASSADSSSDHWEHRLDQHTLRSLYVNHHKRIVSPQHPAFVSASNASSAESSSPSLDLFFAELPPTAYSHGVQRDIVGLLTQSTPSITPHSPAFLRLVSASTTRLSRQLHELVYHHVNQRLLHALTSNEQLQRAHSQQSKQQLSFAYSLVLPPSAASAAPTVEERDEHVKQSQSHLKQLTSKAAGKSGKRLLSGAVLEAIEKAGSIGSLLSLAEDKHVKELSAALQAAAHEQLNKDELTALIRSSLALALRTMSHAHVLVALNSIASSLRLYGDMRLPMFSALTRYSHEVVPLVLAMCKDGTADDKAWKAAAMSRVQDAFGLLTSNDREKERERDREREHVAFSYTLGFLLAHLAVLAETYNRHHIVAMQSITGQCSTAPHYSLFSAPLILDSSPDSAVQLVDLITTLSHLRPEPSLPATYKRMYASIRSLFPPSTRHPNSIQCVRLLLPLLSSLFATPGSLMCRQFKYGRDGPFYECVEEWQERKDILLLIGFQIVARKKGKGAGEERKDGSAAPGGGAEELEWYADENQLDLPLLRYAVQQLTRLNASYYDQRPAKSPLDTITASSALSTAILSLLSLLRTWLLTVRANRISSAVLTRSDLFCSQRQPLLTGCVDILLQLLGRDDSEYSTSDEDRAMEREKACELMSLLFSLLPSQQQLRVLHHSVISTPLRQSLLRLLTVEPTCFSLFPSMHSSSSSATVWERIAKGVNKDKSMGALLSDPAVVSWLIDCHDQGVFHVRKQEREAGGALGARAMKGNVKVMYDWLSKSSQSGGGDDGAMGSTAELSTPPSQSPVLSSGPLSEEKKESIADQQMTLPATAMPSPPLLSFTRSMSALPFVDSADVNEFHSLLDLFYYYLTASSSPSASLRSDIQLLMLHIERCLLVRTLIPLNTYDRTHTPLLLSSYASSLLHHTNDFITTLRHGSAAQSTQSAAPMTSLTPSFPAKLRLPASYQSELHQSPFCFLLSSFVLPFSYVCSLSRLALPLDEQLLSSLHQLMAQCGGYGELDDETQLREWADKEDERNRRGAAPTHTSYSKLHEYVAVSNVLVDVVSGEGEKAMEEVVELLGEKGKAVQSGLIRVREERSVHHAGVELALLHLLDDHVFSSQAMNDEERAASKALFPSRIALPSLYVCITCGAACSTPSALLHHTAHGKDSICCSASALFSLLQQSVLWLLAKVSRHMAAACPAASGAHALAVRDKAKDADERERPLTGVEDIGGPTLPRTVDQWLNSELMKTGLEDFYVSAPSASILPPLAVSASSSFAPSLAASMPGTPKGRSIPLTGGVSTEPSQLLFGGEMTLPQQSTLFAPSSTQQHSTLSTSTLDYENNKTSPTAAASSSSSPAALPPLQLYEKSDSEKLLADDLASKGSVTIESPRGGVTLSLQLLTGGAERDGGKSMGGLYGEKADGFAGRVGGVSLVATTEPYGHAHWLRDLIYGDGEAGELDVAVMSHVTMRLFVQKRRMGGPKAVEASRAVIAALLKHTNKMELALDEFSLWQDDTQHAFSPSLLKAWKQGGELLTDMIATHQQGMQYLCATKGCECEASETHEVSGKDKYKCTAGHVNERCVERDTQPYDSMAERVMSNCQFLLKLRPSLASSAELQLQRLNSMRVRRILRVRPPLPSASPEPSPQYENEMISRQARQRRERERPIRLKPQPQLTWSTTSAAASQLMIPNVPLSPLSAPLPSKRKTADDGTGATAGGDDLTPPSIYTPEQQQRVMRRGSVGTIPPQMDDSLTQRQTSGTHSRQVKRDKLKAAVKRELQAQRWKELREELLLSRNSFVSLFSRTPLSALVLSLAKDFTSETAQQVERLDFALRSAVLRAERRVKGLESLCLLIKNGAVGAKLLALAELNVVVREWSCEKKKHDSIHQRESHSSPNKGEKPAEMSSASFFPSASAAALTSSAVTPLPLKPLRFHRFDDNVLTCGSARLSMICDAFYVLSGVNVNLMRQCINVLLTTAIAGGESTERRDHGEARLELINSERAAADVDVPPQPSSRPPSPSPPPFASQSIGGLTCSSALSLLLGCLHCWHVSFHRSDFTFLRNTGILSVIDMLVQSYPAVPLSATSPLPLPLQPDDVIKVREIGRKSRAVYRMLVLSCLTQEEVRTKGGEEDDEHTDREPSLSDVHGGDKKEEEGIAVDSFEAMLLNSSFSRLEALVSRIQQRGLKQQRQKLDEHDGEDDDDTEEAPTGGSRRLNQRSIRSQLTSFTLTPEQQAQQDEADCDELLSVLLLSCSSARIRLSLTHSPADSTPPSPQLLSPFSSFSLPLSARCLYLLLNLLSSTSFTVLSARCIRHTLRLCQQLLPLLTPATVDSVFMHQLDSVSDDEDELSSHSPFVNHLLASIGYFTCGRFLIRTTFTSSASHSHTVAAELTALLRLLSCSSSWHPTIALAVAQSLRHIRHKQFSPTDDAARIAFYRCWGALAVLGAGNEDARVGARVKVYRVSKRNEKLSKEPHLDDEATAVHVGTVVGRLHHQLLVVDDCDRSFTPHAVSLTQCEFLPVVPCLHPIHTGMHGPSNMTAVVSYINQAFSSSSTPNAVFALYPPSLHATDADSRDQQLSNYVHSLLKVWSVKVLCFAISHSLTIGSPHSVLLQSILRDSSTSTTVNTLMSNLLSIAQNVIPLTQGVGQLAPLERKQQALHAILHDRTLPPIVPSELKQLSIHVDLCHRALSLFPSNTMAAVNWLKGKHIQIKLEESAAKRDTTPDVLRSLQDMGFSAPLCAKALMLCNGDSNQAVNWLVEHGMAEMDSARNGVVTDSWGLEGVDFYQEKGHWIPEHYRDVEGEEVRTSASTSSQSATSSTDKRQSTAYWEASGLMDPYRRLALQTAARMRVQGVRNERYRVEQRGLEGRKTITCALDEDDVRVGVVLRVSSAWCISQQKEEEAEARRQNAANEEYRWFFLTEDNNWAPLDAKDMRKLDEAFAAEHSSTWIGVEEKTPSLIRLDKMCMYNELTGHGRPLKRRRVDRPDNQQQPAADEPPLPVSLYSTLPTDMQMKATELAGLGFPLSHCARALLETKGNVDAAANWIISNEQLLDTMEKDDEKRINKRQQWEQKQKEAADNTTATSTSAHPSSTPVDTPISQSTLYPFAGQLGEVEEVSRSRKQVRLRLVDADSAAVSSIWLPLTACEWDDTSVIHELPELNSRRFQGISGLALDVASSEFILYARRCVLLLLYTLSRAKGGKMELIRNLNANVFVRIVKLAAADAAPLTLPIYVPAWLSSSVSKQTKGASDNATLQVLSSPSNAITAATSSPVSSASSLDIWHILHCILHNPVSIFASAVRDSLLHLLMDDVRQHLMTASSTVRDVDTEHPYQSGVSERQEIRIENASHLLVTFDRRCNINQAHACLSFYADRDCTQELAVFSGSADEFSHLVVPGNHFFYQFVSGGLRQKPYEFGFRFRVRPIGIVHKDETALLSHSLGWPVLVMMADSPQLLDTLLSFHGCSDLIQSLLRYLTVCRSPCKVLVTRALTALCVRIRQPMPSGMFEILLRVMEQLYESNTASGWGSSPFLMSLVDLIRVRPTFRLSESDLWSVESIDNRPAGWFFLTVLRAESLSKSLFHSTRLPHIRLVERAFHELSDMEVLRWCLKQPELCLKLHKQTRGWNSYRRDWMTGINGFTGYAQAAEVLVALKQSLLAECYRFVSWVSGTTGKEWEDKVKRATSAADIARCYMELESALKWGDSYPETERAFGDTWASRRPDWLAAMKGLAAATQVKVISTQEVMEYRWTRAMDEQLVLYIDDMANKSARRLMSLTFRDIEPLSKHDADNPTYSLLRSVPIECVRARFAILKMLSTDYMRVLPVVDLSLRASWSASPLVRSVSKTLIFQQSKMYLWRSMLGRLYSEERPQFVILNRHEAAKKRKDARSRLLHSLFYQLFAHIGMLVDPSSLRRRGQAWMVKFVGEGGHDVGGLYNESLVDICNELQAEGNPNSTHAQLLPLFRLCPNGRHGVGDNRNKYVPNSASTAPLHLAMFEFVGRLMGICCLDNNRALPLDLSAHVWKSITSESISGLDLKAIDYHAWNTINIIRHPQQHKLTQDTFEYLFPDLFFTTESACGQEVELCPGGGKRAVTFGNASEYARLLEEYRVKEFETAIDAISRGLASIIPYEFLTIFTSHQLEALVTGSPEIDIGLLRDKTEYRGNVSPKDKHVQLFWEVLEAFTAEERTAFVQFVSGRSRLPSSALGFGKDMFKLSDHGAALSSGGGVNVDNYLPVAHTCFFALELPRYSSKPVMRNKLLYAVRNCVSIDGDATHEGRANMMMTWSDSD